MKRRTEPGMLGTALKAVLNGLIAYVLAGLALLGTALLTDNAAILMGAALITLCAVNWLGDYLFLRRSPGRRTLRILGLSTLVLLGIFYVTVLMPSAPEKLPDLEGVRYWDLETGSRIAYMKLEPDQAAHEEPIIFVHGGPAIADMEGDAAYFGRLREAGYTV